MTPRFPEQLETERLILRPPALADAERLLAAVTASYPELHQWMEWAKVPYGLDEAQAFCAEAARQAQEDRSYPVLLTRKPGGRIVGASGFESVDWSVPKFGIGYWVRTDCVGLGYASEATRALTRLALCEANAAAQRRVGLDDRVDIVAHSGWNIDESGFDRVVIWPTIPEVSGSWLRALNPSGILVVVFETFKIPMVLRVQRTGDRFEGRFIGVPTSSTPPIWECAESGTAAPVQVPDQYSGLGTTEPLSDPIAGNGLIDLWFFARVRGLPLRFQRMARGRMEPALLHSHGADDWAALTRSCFYASGREAIGAVRTMLRAWSLLGRPRVADYVLYLTVADHKPSMPTAPRALDLALGAEESSSGCTVVLAYDGRYTRYGGAPTIVDGIA